MFNMIDVKESGFYKLIETKSNVKILHLNDRTYAWVEPKNIGEILVVTHKMHRTDCVIALGHYYIYTVDDEPNLSDIEHLELEVGMHAWQGYLLLTGLPNKGKKKARIIPTHETITGSPRYKNSMEQANATAGNINVEEII